MPPAPRGPTISYGPRRSPAERAISASREALRPLAPRIGLQPAWAPPRGGTQAGREGACATSGVTVKGLGSFGSFGGQHFGAWATRTTKPTETGGTRPSDGHAASRRRPGRGWRSKDARRQPPSRTGCRPLHRTRPRVRARSAVRPTSPLRGQEALGRRAGPCAFGQFDSASSADHRGTCTGQGLPFVDPGHQGHLQDRAPGTQVDLRLTCLGCGKRGSSLLSPWNGTSKDICSPESSLRPAYTPAPGNRSCGDRRGPPPGAGEPGGPGSVVGRSHTPPRSGRPDNRSGAPHAMRNPGVYVLGDPMCDGAGWELPELLSTDLSTTPQHFRRSALPRGRPVASLGLAGQ